MPTFKQLQDYVLDECQQLMAKPDFSLTKVKAYLNRGQQDFVRKTKCLSQTYTLTTVANQVSYSINDAIFHVKHVRYIEDSANEFGDVLKPHPGGYDALPKEKCFGIPEFYYIRSGHTRGTSVLGTYPIVSAGSESIEVEAYYTPSDLSADGDISVIKEPWHDALVEYAVWRLFKIYSHENKGFQARMLQAKAFYEDVVSDASAAFIKENEDMPTVIVDYYG